MRSNRKTPEDAPDCRSRAYGRALLQMRDERPGAEKNDHDHAERRQDDENRLIGGALTVFTHSRYSLAKPRRVGDGAFRLRQAPKKKTRR